MLVSLLFVCHVYNVDEFVETAVEHWLRLVHVVVPHHWIFVCCEVKFFWMKERESTFDVDHEVTLVAVEKT